MTILRGAVNGLISVGAVFVFLGAALLVVWLRPNRRGPRIWLTVLLIAYAILAMPFVPYVGSRLLGHRYAPWTGADVTRDVRAVVLLGAGAQIVENGGQHIALLDATGAARVLEAANVYRTLDNPWVISSGGTRRGREQFSSAVAMKIALVQLGVDPSRILLEARSLTTRDEAVMIAPMLRQLGVDRFVLVTHRSHMVRSMSVFRQQHLAPIPAIVPDELDNAKWSKLLTPDAEGLTLSQGLLHEVLGLAYYRWRGWTAD